MTDLLDLNFSLHDTLHATHGLHAFAAKCPPPLAAWGIRTFSEQGEHILDPMSGSGTTLVEGRLVGRHVHGVDLDPLSCLLSRVKSTPLDDQSLDSACSHLLNRISSDCALWDRARARGASADDATASLHLILPAIRDRERWFLPEVAAKLAIVKRAIGHVEMPAPLRDFCYVAFSSLIIARTSVANARDVVHSRHHHRTHHIAPDVPALFAGRLSRMRRQMANFVAQLPADHRRHTTVVQREDARHLPLAADSIDLVFTSPPYCNALDYPRAHQFAVAWLGDLFEMSSDEYTRLARTYIGSDRASKALPLDRAIMPGGSPTAQRVIDEVAHVDPVKAAVIQRYFQDMSAALHEIGRVLRPRRHAVLVVCPSHIRRVSIPSHEIFIEMGECLTLVDGSCLRAVARHERVIDDRKRLLPYMDHTALAQRMRTEHVIVLQKVP